MDKYMTQAPPQEQAWKVKPALPDHYLLFVITRDFERSCLAQWASAAINVPGHLMQVFVLQNAIQLLSGHWTCSHGLETIIVDRILIHICVTLTTGHKTMKYSKHNNNTACYRNHLMPSSAAFGLLSTAYIKLS